LGGGKTVPAKGRALATTCGKDKNPYQTKEKTEPVAKSESPSPGEREKGEKKRGGFTKHTTNQTIEKMDGDGG